MDRKQISSCQELGKDGEVKYKGGGVIIYNYTQLLKLTEPHFKESVLLAVNYASIKLGL